MLDLTGKSALVTGASGGIGADIARAAQRGGGGCPIWHAG
jgi:NAD(P)-dependent dehydrogenase (short-subunit alcohol dehydrogenase family)